MSVFLRQIFSETAKLQDYLQYSVQPTSSSNQNDANLIGISKRGKWHLLRPKLDFERCFSNWKHRRLALYCTTAAVATIDNVQ